ncbi:MAG: thioredoxin family protein [Thermomicrobiales bacterium]
MPGWQRFYAAHVGDDFALISVAVDHAGAAAPRPYIEAAGATFPTVVDQQAVLSRRLGFKVVPNGVLLDRDGTIRWAKFGGFSIDNPDDVAVVERFIAGHDPGPSPEERRPYALGAIEQELIETKIALGHALLESGRTDDAAAAWRYALHLDPENFTIRKQIWAIEHPEKFHPAIDFDWQKVQLAQERAAEIASGFCGPDGCPLPWAHTSDGTPR